MRKSFVAIGAALLLLGVGCVGRGEETLSDLGLSDARQAEKRVEVQAAANALVAAGEALDENAVQALVSVPIIDGVTEFGVSGYFEETSAEIDWNASRWSNNNSTIELVSKDGISLGTWIDVSPLGSGEWKATSAFWFE